MSDQLASIDTAARVRALLAELGDNADQVANTLRAAGVTGIRDAGSACPIANYLCRNAPTLGDLEVSAEEIALLLPCDEEPGDRYVYVDPTDAVADFIDFFDEGVYLDLVGGEGGNA